MKPWIAFGIGTISGAVVTFLILSFSVPKQAGQSKEAEVFAHKADLGRAEQVAQRDRDMIRAPLQERHASREVVPPRPAPATVAAAQPTTATGDSAIANYLGRPVSAPVNLDHRYSAGELSAVFRDLTETLGFKVTEIRVDTSEFPFVIHGRVDINAGAEFFKKINSELKALPGYT